MRTDALRPILVWLLSLTLASCGGSDAPPTEVSMTIGAAGGTLDGPDGVQLIVPPGALSQDTVLKIARTDAGAPALPEGLAAAGPVYEFTPHGQVFDLPVTVRMPHQATAGAAFSDVLMANPGSEWQPMDATVADGFAQWQRLSLSWAAGMACSHAGPVTDPYWCTFPIMGSTLSATPASALTAGPVAAGGRRWSVSAVASLTISTSFSAAPDCGDARLRILRRDSGARDGTLLDTPVTLTPRPGSTTRAGGSHTTTFAVDETFNPKATLIVSFSCQRPGRTTRQGDFDVHYLTLAIPPAPPGAPAAPTISAQPASLTVADGASAGFSVSASAPDTLAITWQRSADAGATWTDVGSGANLVLAAAAASDDGSQFRARVCNVVGSLQTCVTSAVATLTVTSTVSESVAFGWDFESDQGTMLSGMGAEPDVIDLATSASIDDQYLSMSRTGVQGFAGLGPAGRPFAGTMARFASGTKFVLDLSGMPPHSALSLRFLLAAIDSLDGSGTFPAGDYLRIEVDGVTVFRESFENSGGAGPQSYVPPAGGELARKVELGFSSGSFYLDSAYDMALEPRLQRIPHSGHRVSIVFTFEGPGAQPLDDESWGIENLRVILHP